MFLIGFVITLPIICTRHPRPSMKHQRSRPLGS